MKNTIITIATILLGISTAFADKPLATTSTYNSSDDRVKVEIERGRGDVRLHVHLANPNEYTAIFIERGETEADNFNSCKQLSASQIQADNVQIDKYSSPDEIYYRLKTVTKDGAIRAYPAILLAAAK